MPWPARKGRGKAWVKTMFQLIMAVSRSARLIALSVLAGVLTLLPGISQALGLGKLTVYSALSEPLNAEIPFTSLSDTEIKTLTTEIVKRLDYAATGIKVPPLSPNIMVAVVEQPDGARSLKLYTERPLREPYLRFFLQVDWAGGRLVREFTALIDPPDPAGKPRSDKPTDAPPSTGPQLPKPAQAPLESAPAEEQPTLASEVGQPEKPAQAEVVELQVQLPEQASGSTGPIGAKRPASRRKPVAAVALPRARMLERSTVKPAVEKQKEKTRSAIDGQKRQLESEIKVWAATQQGPVQDELRDSKPASQIKTASSTQAPQQTKVTTKPPAKVELPQQGQGMLGIVASVFGEHSGEIMTIGLALAAGLFLIAGGFVLFVYMRRVSVLQAQFQETVYPAKKTSALAEDKPVFQERRGGPGRRRRFVPVPFERRRGARRHSDRIPEAVGQVYTGKVDTVEETDVYMAYGRAENAEVVLKEAIAKNPERHGLRVKLLSLYYQRQDRPAFENLANQLYAALEPDKHAEKIRGDENIDESALRAEVDRFAPDEEPEFTIDARDLEEPDDKKDMIARELPETNRRMPTDKNNADEPEAPGTGQPADKRGETRPRMESLKLSLPAEEQKALERDMAALKMDVPKAEDESTQHIMGELQVDRPTDNDESERSGDERTTTDRGMKVLKVDDLADIKEAVERGMELIEAAPAPDEKRTKRKAREKNGAKKAATRSRKGKRTQKKARKSDSDTQAITQQWKDPAAKIDLAKAYIDMGDAERARSILNDVLDQWNRGSGTSG